MLGVVDGSVEIEREFRHYAHLLSYLASKLTAKGAVLVLERKHNIRLLFGGEDAYVDLCYREIRADPYFAHGHHGAAPCGHSLAADDLRQVFLYFAGNLELPCGWSLFHTILQ